jgi:hypothetical protein
MPLAFPGAMYRSLFQKHATSLIIASSLMDLQANRVSICNTDRETVKNRLFSMQTVVVCCPPKDDLRTL